MRQKKSYYVILLLLISFYFLEGYLHNLWALTVEEERELGKKIFLEMGRRIEWVRDLTLQTYLDRMGASLVTYVGATPFEFKFYLIKSSEPNAFAIPGGYIFVTTGLIGLAENEAELAGVLSHEIAHVTARHIAQMVERAKRINIVTTAAAIAGLLLGGGGKPSGAVATTAMATGEALALKYTRENETDADQNALQLMIKAGYDPHGMISFLYKIYKTSLTAGPQIPTYLSTHPAIENRISLLENLLLSEQRSMGPFKTFGDYKKIHAKAFVEERDSKAAVTYYQSQIEKDPQSVEGYYGLGLAYQKMGRLDRSLEAFQKAQSLVPYDREVLRELGIVFFLSGKLDQAIETFEAIPNLPLFGSTQDNDFLALYYLGRGYQEKGDLSKALPLFLKVQKGVPEFIDVYLNLGSVYGRMGLKGLSHFYFGKHFKLRGDSKNALLHFRTALEDLKLGSPEREEAQREIRELTSTRSIR